MRERWGSWGWGWRHEPMVSVREAKMAVSKTVPLRLWVCPCCLWSWERGKDELKRIRAAAAARKLTGSTKQWGSVGRIAQLCTNCALTPLRPARTWPRLPTKTWAEYRAWHCVHGSKSTRSRDEWTIPAKKKKATTTLQSKLEAAEVRLKRAVRREKLATTIRKKWQKKVRYYEKQLEKKRQEKTGKGTGA